MRVPAEPVRSAKPQIGVRSPGDRVVHLAALTRKKAPPAPNRTDIYDKMDKFLKLPSGELARLADAQRREQLNRNWVRSLCHCFERSAT